MIDVMVKTFDLNTNKFNSGSFERTWRITNSTVIITPTMIVAINFG